MPAPQIILDLVQRFHDSREQYRSGRYNEAQLRREFLDPFFSALGWDMTNAQNNAPQYREVIQEDTVEIEGQAKAPDYAFGIFGVRKFFVEAKKPAVNIRYDIHPAFQLRRYAWSAHLPLSILTDFEEFAVYDTRVKPDHKDSASVARTMVFTYAEYAERWDEIASIFSKDAILKGSFDRYVQDTKAKKGTTEVDDDFLKSIEGWRELLARNIALRNPSARSESTLNYAVQMTIDRLIFLRICEDRGIEPESQLRDLTTTAAIYPRLVNLYIKADQKYNSGLFHFNAEKGQTTGEDSFTPNLAIDDKVLKEIITSLYYPESAYAFNVIPVEILGQVYEQFLGKVIRLTAGGQAKVEEKPEVRKAGGVYYTPRYIVDYIVENTVGKLLEGKTPKEAAELRVVDPACGSGSFLLGAYQYLLDWHHKYYLDPVNGGADSFTRGRNPVLAQRSADEYHLTTAEKKRILVNNIYGVDLDHQAVEVTKLSLLLKLLEEETGQLSLGFERVLPDLGHNIRCGNSLIGWDYFQGQLMADDEEYDRRKPFNWEKEFQSVFIKGGFDVVIGNPPYVRIQRLNYDEIDYYYRSYESPTSKADLSLIFLEKSLQLINPMGVIGLISTSQWLSTEYGSKLRSKLQNGNLFEIVHFGSLPVFAQAQTYPAIFLLSRHFNEFIKLIKVNDAKELTIQGIRAAESSDVASASLSNKPWTMGAFDLIAHLDLTKPEWKPLIDFAQPLIGSLTGFDDAFVVSNEQCEAEQLELELLIPYALRGGEIYKFQMVQPQNQVIYPYTAGEEGEPILIAEKLLREQYPNIYNHLLPYKPDLLKRMDSRKFYATGNQWYRLVRPGNFRSIYPEKLIIKGIDKLVTVGLLSKGTAFNGANCPGIIPIDNSSELTRYLLGILNSNLIAFYLRSSSPEKLNDYRRYSATNLRSVPIIPMSSIDTPILNTLAFLVDKLLDIRKESNATPQYEERRTAKFINVFEELNRIIYRIYGLAENEAKLIEHAIGNKFVKN